VSTLYWLTMAALCALSALVWLGAWWCERRDIRGGVRGVCPASCAPTREGQDGKGRAHE